MPNPIDISEVIQTAVDDARVDDNLQNDTIENDVVESPVEAQEAPVEPVEATDEVAAQPAAEPSVEAPAAPVDPNAPQFQMDKKLGIPSHTNGRENRIPYTRVKKIVENAEKAAIKPLQEQLAQITPRIQEYEARLSQVAEFENIMVNDAPRFLEMLSTIPTYQKFFQTLEQLSSMAQTQAQAQVQTVDDDPMPEPDDQETGSYTMDGLKKLLDWQARQVESRVTKQVESKYEPVRRAAEDFERQQAAERQLNQLIPVVQKQIDEARRWPRFKENEDKITQFLNRYPTSTLEQAYQYVVVPQLVTDEQKLRADIRAQVMSELKKAPTSTSVSTGAVKPTPRPAGGENRSLEDVIAEQARQAGLIR